MFILYVLALLIGLPLACWYEKHKGAKDYRELERKRKERGYK